MSQSDKEIGLTAFTKLANEIYAQVAATLKKTLATDSKFIAQSITGMNEESLNEVLNQIMNKESVVNVLLSEFHTEIKGELIDEIVEEYENSLSTTYLATKINKLKPDEQQDLFEKLDKYNQFKEDIKIDLKDDSEFLYDAIRGMTTRDRQELLKDLNDIDSPEDKDFYKEPSTKDVLQEVYEFMQKIKDEAEDTFQKVYQHGENHNRKEVLEAMGDRDIAHRGAFFRTMGYIEGKLNPK